MNKAQQAKWNKKFRQEVGEDGALIPEDLLLEYRANALSPHQAAELYSDEALAEVKVAAEKVRQSRPRPWSIMPT